MKWLHQLFNPHCPECRLENAENRICESCETLKIELAAVRRNNEQLIQSLLEQFAPKPVVQIPDVELKVPINPASLPWRARKEMLEAEDRAKARVLREHSAELVESKKSIEELEKELEVSDGKG